MKYRCGCCGHLKSESEFAPSMVKRAKKRKSTNLDKCDSCFSEYNWMRRFFGIGFFRPPRQSQEERQQAQEKFAKAFGAFVKNVRKAPVNKAA